MQLLFIHACARDSQSRTLQLAEHFLAAWQQQWPEHTATTLALYAEDLHPHTAATLEERDSLLRQGQLDHPLFRYARQFAAADKIVIAAPYWDLSFPALLKTYLEQVCVNGIAFQYVADGVRQLCQAEKLLYITTAGGEIGPYNFGYDYVMGLCQFFFGIPQLQFASAEGLDIVGADVPAILDDARQRLVQLAATF